MKFTKSQDGALRATIHVEHRIGRGEISDCICKVMAGQLEIFDKEDGHLIVETETHHLTKHKSTLIAKVKEDLRNGGRSAWDFWSDDVPRDQVQAIRKYANEAVDRLFPELKPKENQ